MNRHQRRAAAKSGQPQRPPDDPSPPSSTLQVRDGGLGSSETANLDQVPHINLSGLKLEPDQFNTPEGAGLALEASISGPSAKPKSGLVMRFFSKLLLSRWVLKRVDNPEVERLLMSVALEANRKDVIDELTRRQALRRTTIHLTR